MAERITGGRAPAVSQKPGTGRAAKTARGRRQTRRHTEAGDVRRLAQLGICSGAFVLIVAAKLVLPEQAAPIRERLSRAMSQNMDVQAVFSTVGRTLAGEGDVPGMARDVWQSVFQPEPLNGEPVEVSAAVEAVPEPAEASAGAETAMEPVTLPGGAALQSLREFRTAPPQDEPAPEPVSELESAPVEPKQTPILYTGNNIPDKVSLEQAILDFDYCTPVMGTLTSPFGYRTQPGTGEERFHHGLDLAADTGTPVRCFADGTVTATGESTSYGNYCIVAHPGGFSTLYAHCSRVTVSAGQSVALGETIAEVGSTGNATGPHLHFELQKENVYYNPIYYVVHS